MNLGSMGVEGQQHLVHNNLFTEHSLDAGYWAR